MQRPRGERAYLVSSRKSKVANVAEAGKPEGEYLETHSEMKVLRLEEIRSFRTL